MSITEFIDLQTTEIVQKKTTVRHINNSFSLMENYHYSRVLINEQN